MAIDEDDYIEDDGNDEDEEYDLQRARPSKAVSGCKEAEAKVKKWISKIKNDADMEADVPMVLRREGRAALVVTECSLLMGDDPAEFASRIVDQASEDAQTSRGRIGYVLKYKGRPVGVQFELKVKSAFKDDEGPSFDEDEDNDPSRRGQTMQAQRFAENFAKLGFRASNDTQKMLFAMISDKDDQIREKDAVIARLQRGWEEAQSMQWQRDLERQKLEDEKEKRKGIMGLVQRIGLPLLQQQFFPGVPLPAAAMGGSPSLVLKLKGLFTKLSPEKQMSILQILSHEEQEELMSILQETQGGAPEPEPSAPMPAPQQQQEVSPPAPAPQPVPSDALAFPQGHPFARS